MHAHQSLLRAALAASLFAGAGCAHGAGDHVVYLRHGAGNAAPVVTAEETACRAGNAAACLEAAYVLFEGYGVAKAPPEATKMAERACALGAAAGCAMAANTYADNTTPPTDERRAFDLAQTGCRLGSAASCTLVGEMLARGTGVPVDLARAQSFLARGCRRGDAIGCTFRNVLAGGSKTLPAKEPHRSACVTQGDVLGVLGGATNAAKRCYEGELQRDPTVCGKIVTKFAIDGDGEVIMVDVAASSMGNAAVEDCLQRLVGSLQFPRCRDASVASVTYPWIFRSADAPCHDGRPPLPTSPAFPERSQPHQPARPQK